MEYTFKKNKVSDYLSFSWLLVGFCIETLFAVLTERSFNPIANFIFGLKNGLKA